MICFVLRYLSIKCFNSLDFMAKARCYKAETILQKSQP